MTGGTDHQIDTGEGHYAGRLLERERAADRGWRRVDWHPVMTYTSIIVASGWLAGAWYAWKIDGNGAQMTLCLIGALSTIWPGIPWQELVAMQRRVPEPSPTTRDVLNWSTGETVTVDIKTGRPVVEVRKMDEA